MQVKRDIYVGKTIYYTKGRLFIIQTTYVQYYKYMCWVSSFNAPLLRSMKKASVSACIQAIYFPVSERLLAVSELNAAQVMLFV